MNTSLLETLVNRYLDGVASPAELEQLSAQLENDPEARKLYRKFAGIHAALASEESSLEAALPPLPQPSTHSFLISPKRPWWHPSSFGSLAAGIVLGIGCASLVWGISAPRAQILRQLPISDGDFERNSGPISRGFPAAAGFWSGDTARAESLRSNPMPASGEKALRFVRAEAENETQPAKACDVFQWVDLSAFAHELQSGDAALELSASFLNSTAEPCTFSCRVFLFGAINPAAEQWPSVARNTIAAGSRLLTTSTPKGASPQWETVCAKVIAPSHTRLALIEILAAPVETKPPTAQTDTEKTSFRGHFADAVQLQIRFPSGTTKTQRISGGLATGRAKL
ncbi:MAG: hypothetical protein RLZZ399_88 [Verrucomicrobiota bacterium]|jgi:hypothetical protein